MKVSWDDSSQYMEKLNSCSKPPTSHEIAISVLKTAARKILRKSSSPHFSITMFPAFSQFPQRGALVVHHGTDNDSALQVIRHGRQDSRPVVGGAAVPVPTAW